MDLKNLSAILAMGPAPSPPGTKSNPTGDMIRMMGMLALFVVMMYFVLFRPQQKRAKQQAEMLKTVRPGDKIVTSGGIVGVVITVKGGGSGNGIAALINKTVDFADASREIKAEEVAQAKANGVNPVKTEVARDGVVVIVNTSNAVSGLTKEQLGKIYAGEITNWKAVGGADAPIVLLGRDSSSGTYAFIKDDVLGKLPNKPDYAKSMRNLQSTQAIVDEVSKNTNAIGYIGLGYENASIKPVPIDGTNASEATVLDGSYALSRGLNMYSDGEPTGAKKAYIDWILSAEGQALVKEQGFVPLAK